MPKRGITPAAFPHLQALDRYPYASFPYSEKTAVPEGMVFVSSPVSHEQTPATA